MKQLSIPYEVADGITLATLVDYRKYLKGELKKWRKNPKTDTNPTGYWLHPEDVTNNIRVIDALDIVIKQYGGSNA